MSENIHKKCVQCKHDLEITEFKLKKDGTRTKTCFRCLFIQSESKIRNKCMHNKQRSRCKICCVDIMCVHSIRKNRCPVCMNKNLCLHNKQKVSCTICKQEMKDMNQFLTMISLGNNYE
jgi:hypothetical protein